MTSIGVHRGERTADRAALRAVRDTRRHRGRGRSATRGDLAYAGYLAIMLGVIVVAPIMRAAVLGLAAGLPAAEEAAFGNVPGAAGLLAAVLVVATALLVLSGARVGPASASLPVVDLLLTAAPERSRWLAASVRGAFGSGAGAGALLAALLVAARAVRGEFDGWLAVALVLSGAGLGAMAVAALLAGQLGRRTRLAVTGGLGVLAALHAGLALGPGVLVGDPWGVVAVLVIAGSSGNPLGVLLPAVLVLGCGWLAVLVAPAAVDRLRWETLREQAATRDIVRALALSGDARAVAARLGAPVRTGRHWRWRVPGRGAILARDLLGIVRTPARSLAALLGVAAAQGAICAGALLAREPGVAALVGAAALPILSSALGPWVRGLRAAADSAGGSPLLPFSPAGLLLRHLVVPGLLALLVGLGCAAAVVLAGGARVFPWPVAAGAVCAAVAAALLLRLIGALKGPLPIALLAPVPTPMGDFSALMVVGWSLDGPIWAVLIGAALAALLAVAPVAALVSALLVLGALGLWAAARLRALRS